jgi:protein TonB
MPKAAAKKEDASGEVPGSGLPGVLSGVGTPNPMMNVVRDRPVSQPKISPQKVKVSSGVAQGLLVHQVTLQYPSQARQQGIQGTVVVQAVIAKDGSLHNVKAISGSSMLRQAAVDAVKQWKYRPYSLDGEPVEADTEISIKFNPN